MLRAPSNPPTAALLVRIGLVLSLAIGLLTGGSQSARAYQVTVGGTTYEITTVNSNFTASLRTQLQATDWWLSPSTAQALADASPASESGTWFVYNFASQGNHYDVFLYEVTAGTPTQRSLKTNQSPASGTRTYAISATIISVIPEIDASAMVKGMVVLAAFAAWLFGRRRLQRQGLPRPVSIT
ncbi:hypothetical protein HKCCSP123_12810 [Rhodobacterales bacterium HKCCSP123]|nr:hypothetical protein [Rhodobacterales bacterium HKCCSP123]